MKSPLKTGLLVLLAIVVICLLTPAVNFTPKRHPTKVNGVNNVTHVEVSIIPGSETNPPAKP